MCMCILLCIRVYAHSCMCIYELYINVCLSDWVLVAKYMGLTSLSIYLSIYLSTYVFIHLSLFLSSYPSIYLPQYLTFCLSYKPIHAFQRYLTPKRLLPRPVTNIPWHQYSLDPDAHGGWGMFWQQRSRSLYASFSSHITPKPYCHLDTTWITKNDPPPPQEQKIEKNSRPINLNSGAIVSASGRLRPTLISWLCFAEEARGPYLVCRARSGQVGHETRFFH